VAFAFLALFAVPWHTRCAQMGSAKADLEAQRWAMAQRRGGRVP